MTQNDEAWRRPTRREYAMLARRLRKAHKGDRTIVGALFDIGIWFCLFILASTLFSGDMSSECGLVAVILALIAGAVVAQQVHTYRALWGMRCADGVLLGVDGSAHTCSVDVVGHGPMDVPVGRKTCCRLRQAANETPEAAVRVLVTRSGGELRIHCPV